MTSTCSLKTHNVAVIRSNHFWLPPAVSKLSHVCSLKLSQQHPLAVWSLAVSGEAEVAHRNAQGRAFRSNQEAIGDWEMELEAADLRSTYYDIVIFMVI